MSPRWASHDEYMPKVVKLIIQCEIAENRPPRLAEVMALDGRIGQRLASTLLREACRSPRPGRPWPDHAEYMPEVRELINQRKRRGRVTVAEVQEELGVGEDLAPLLLEKAGVPSGRQSDEDLRPQIKAIVARDGERWSLAGVVRELRIHPTRARRLADELGLLPDEIPPGRSVTGSAWWTEAANNARWNKPRGD
jgi:hypothetical protein